MIIGDIFDRGKDVPQIFWLFYKLEEEAAKAGGHVSLSLIHICIEDDLSTYSSHLTNMKTMMKSCNERSLILIDEFGGGTEPQIGGCLLYTSKTNQVSH